MLAHVYPHTWSSLFTNLKALWHHQNIPKVAESPGISEIFSSSPMLQPSGAPEGTYVLDGRVYWLEYSSAKKSTLC